MSKDFTLFEKSIALEFNDKSLLRQAFTHRSYLNENKGVGFTDNERLEFLGDAVLQLAVTNHLFNIYPDTSEGDLTSYRSALVNTQTLSRTAAEIGMGEYLLLSHGESRDTGRARTIILADAFEALVGAIYLDQGFAAAERFIAAKIFPLIADVVAGKAWLDAKSRFQESAQEHTGITPIYKTTKETGPDHDRVFTVGVYLGKELAASGEGPSKQEAEQEAARKALTDRGWL